MSDSHGPTVGLAPVPDHVRTLLVFGGSFDPPTIAHFELPKEVMRRISVDWLLYVPVGQSPLKERPPVATPPQRLGMLAAGLAGNESVSISTIEIDRPGASFTVDTLSRLTSLLHSSVRLRLLIGADQAAQFHRWKESRRIIEMADPVVMLRVGQFDRASLLAALEQNWRALDMDLWQHRLLDLPPIAGSSTEARALIAEGGPEHPGLRDLVPRPVLEFIRERGLYR